MAALLLYMCEGVAAGQGYTLGLGEDGSYMSHGEDGDIWGHGSPGFGGDNDSSLRVLGVCPHCPDSHSSTSHDSARHVVSLPEIETLRCRGASQYDHSVARGDKFAPRVDGEGHPTWI